MMHLSVQIRVCAHMHTDTFRHTCIHAHILECVCTSSFYTYNYIWTHIREYASELRYGSHCSGCQDMLWDSMRSCLTAHGLMPG